jgi:hypothetical protein
MKYYVSDLFIDSTLHSLVLVDRKIFGEVHSSMMLIRSLTEKWNTPICLMSLNGNYFEYLGDGSESNNIHTIQPSSLKWFVKDVG